MLAWKGDVDSHATFHKDMSVPMETVEGVLNPRKVVCGDSIPADEVTEVHKCRETLDHVGGEVARDGGEIDLLTELGNLQWLCNANGAFTFISAFESSPVHWLKSRPSGKRRSPGNSGTADKLGDKVRR